MTSAPHTEHRVEDLCPAGSELYARALRDGWVLRADADATPCLVDHGLLHPAVEDLGRLEPVAPSVALHRLLRVSESRIADERRREERLAETFEPLVRIDSRGAPATGTPATMVISGKERINQAIEEAMSEATRELLCIQPNSNYHTQQGENAQAVALSRDQAVLDRGASIRTLYQHTQRHLPLVFARYERLTGDTQARTLDEVTERTIIVDRTVAFVPANKDRTLALEIRHPALVEYFATTFDRLWRLATPLYPKAAPQPSLNGITARQRAIASLLVEGHTDAVIADRLGLNIRTARVHIAKLATTLGSESRAQLGYLIGQSGILDPPG
ncbi:LuxR C-terminal-related transcriptional regulator [Streptomyces sp. NBC_01518]|uniref:helix-turn-helix transcriptional regulator n=1 Tax=Streptomyces sp. NBC_01518 TaxID=2903891 RepID=UPI00386B4BE0